MVWGPRLAVELPLPLELLGGLITAGPGHEIDGLPSTAPEILPPPLGFDTDLPTEYGMVY